MAGFEAELDIIIKTLSPHETKAFRTSIYLIVSKLFGGIASLIIVFSLNLSFEQSLLQPSNASLQYLVNTPLLTMSLPFRFLKWTTHQC